MSEKINYATKVCDHTVSVVRDGKSETVAPNKAFKFSESEIADIERVMPGSLRDPVDESLPEDEVAKEPAKTSGKAGSKAEDL